MLSILAALLLGCGGAGAPNFSMAPEPRSVLVGDQLALSAQPNVDLAGDLEWEVEEQYGGGLRSSQGGSTVYFAPEAAGTYHLVLRADRADGRKLKQSFEVQVLPIFRLDPARVQLAPGATASFSATIKGLGRSTVKWTVDEPGGGQISEGGHYQAPARPGTFHVTATSTVDPQYSAQATILVS